MIKTSPNDPRQYLDFSLPNGLQVVVVSEENAHQAACSLAVSVGSFDDPIDRPGFAHFIEHLLFAGNKAYPVPNAFNQFVSQHGGHCNAWTASEQTCYHFDIQPNYFESAVTQFAAIFDSPLFSDDAIEQELSAIDAEFKLKLKDDSRRIQQVHKDTVNPAHPFHKFSVGNKQTLSDKPGHSVKDDLSAFFDYFYVASRMKLVVVAPWSVKDIQHLITVHFANLKGAEQRQFQALSQPLYREQDLGLMFTIQPVKTMYKLNVSFAFPDITPWYTTKCSSFIAHLLNYEGQGSLFDALRNKGFINGISAGNGISGSNFKDFNVTFDLTPIGEKHLNYILAALFDYIDYLQSNPIPDYLYSEQKQLAEISFQFQEGLKPLQLANELVMNMLYYPMHDLIYGDYRMDGLDRNLLTTIFDLLSAENMRVTLITPNCVATESASWYHTPYSKMPLNKSEFESIETDCQFHWPPENPYLKTPIRLLDNDFDGAIPMLIEEQTEWRCWFKQDISFKVPKGNLYVALDLPKGQGCEQHQAMTRLFVDLVMDALAEKHFLAEMAGLSYNLYAHSAGMTLYTAGLSSNQANLLYDLLHDIRHMAFEEVRFNEVKQQLLAHWLNAENNKPISQLFAELNTILLPQSTGALKLASALKTVTFSQFVTFTKTLFDQVFVEIMIYGNWQFQDAKQINQRLHQLFSDTELVSETKREVLAVADVPNRFPQIHIADAELAALIYIQAPPMTSTELFKIKALMVTLSQLLAPFAFEYLRQYKQLGYLTGAGFMPVSQQPGIAIYVQTAKPTEHTLKSYLEQCLEEFLIVLSDMSEGQFEQHKQAICHQYAELPTNFAAKCQQLWLSIGNKDWQFDQKEQVTAQIQALSLSQLIAFAKQHLDMGNSNRITLTTLNTTTPSA